MPSNSLSKHTGVAANRSNKPGPSRGTALRPAPGWPASPTRLAERRRPAAYSRTDGKHIWSSSERARAVPPRPAGLAKWSEQARRVLVHPSVVLAVILTAQLMVVLDGTIVNVALPHIQRSLGFSGATLSWVLNVYILTFGGLLLLGARLGDLAGRRQIFLAGIALFSLSSFAGGFAPTATILLAARAAQGVGAALAAPSALALLTTMFPEGAQRVRALGLFTAVSTAGAALGLVAGGLLTQWASWRWVMFVNVPIGIAVLFAGRYAVAETSRRSGHHDLPGAVMSTAGMGSVVLGLVEAGTSGWGSAITIGSFVAGLTLLVGFVLNEQRAEEPVLPLVLLAHPGRVAANVARGLVYSGMYGMFFFLSQSFQDLRGYSPLLAGAAFLPVPASVFLGSQVTTRTLLRRYSPKSVMLGGIALVVASLVLVSRLGAGVPYPEMVLVLVLLGLGSGISLVSLISAALAGVEPKYAGAASGLVNVAQQIGAALGLAVLVTVFGDATRHAELTGHTRSPATIMHGLTDVFSVAAIFAVGALAIVALLVRGGHDGRPRTAAPQAQGVPSLAE